MPAHGPDPPLGRVDDEEADRRVQEEPGDHPRLHGGAEALLLRRLGALRTLPDVASPLSHR